MILIEEDNPQVRIRGGNSKSFRKGYFSNLFLLFLKCSSRVETRNQADQKGSRQGHRG